MTLKRQLSYGILLILVLIMGFFSLTGFSYHSFSNFFTFELYPDMNVARLYEQFMTQWVRLAEGFSQNLSSGEKGSEIIPEEIRQNLEKTLQTLDGKINDKDRRIALIKINSVVSSFTWEMNSCRRLIELKQRILKEDKGRLVAVAELLSQRINKLADGFSKMKEDFSSLLKSSDFRDSPSVTKAFVNKIFRIEKDLVIVHQGITEFAEKKKEGLQKVAFSSTTNVAGQIQKRLQAILALVESSLEEAKSAFHVRVLKKIQREVGEFRKAFLELRDSLDKPNSEILEIDDELEQHRNSISELRNLGIGLSISEADFFWDKIAFSSLTLLQKNKWNFLLSMILIIMIFLVGIYCLNVFPQRIAGPLHDLNDKVSEFQLGKPFERPLSKGTDEVTSLENSFAGLADRLNYQVGANVQYINAIEKLSKIYIDLSATATFEETQREDFLEGGINQILEEIMAGIDGLDLVKVMLLKTGPTDGARFFERIGQVQVSGPLQDDNEFKDYLSTTLPEKDKNSRNFSEVRIPFREGLTGYLFSEAGLMTAQGDALDSWKKELPITSISDIPYLRSREWEGGLTGGIYGIVLERELTPNDDSELNRLGILTMYFHDSDCKLSYQDLKFAQTLARQISFTIESSELLKIREKQKRTEFQLEMAAQIQESLLPKDLPFLPELKISSLNKPAYEVGGDYYDFFKLDDNRLGIVIADASGKNVPAAIIMTVFKTTLSTIDLKQFSAGEVFSLANSVLLKNMGLEDRFITAMYVILNIGNGEVELACAGHNPALLVSGKGSELTISEWTGQGIPLGILDLNYSTSQYKIKPGEFLLMYTDGVTEARNHDEEEFGLGRLKKFLSRPRGENMARSLYQEMIGFTGASNQHDDITAVTVEFLGGSHELSV